MISAGTAYSREVPMLNGNAALAVSVDAIEIGGSGSSAVVYVQGCNDLENWGFFNSGALQTGLPAALMTLNAASPFLSASVGQASGAGSPYASNFNYAYVRLAVVVPSSVKFRIHATINPTGV
jgi:hypothetical protein